MTTVSSMKDSILKNQRKGFWLCCKLVRLSLLLLVRFEYLLKLGGNVKHPGVTAAGGRPHLASRRFAEIFLRSIYQHLYEEDKITLRSC